MARSRTRGTRGTLSRDEVVRAGVAIADGSGIGALSMRAVARELGVEAMSLYHHVAGKEDLLDGMVDAVFGELHLPRTDGDWRAELRRRSVSGREALLRHRWAVGLMDSRTSPGLATLRHHDAVLGCLRAAGFSVTMAAHAFALLDAHLYGFLVQEIALPFDEGDDLTPLADAMLGENAEALPHLAEVAREVTTRPGYRFGDEFHYGLDLVLDALEARRDG
ncbi:TetR/AcrR family transcriptional regulator [Nocardioides sp. GCM10027113]|uniref:TetR/AcrR family transcriptional regulator n=1 Tax=unclassified Nocardioides TaxID=2615069 RepID=UPI0036063845